MSVKLANSWIFESDVTFRKHIINLYHDGFTGIRSLMVDFVEVPGSEGTFLLRRFIFLLFFFLTFRVITPCAAGITNIFIGSASHRLFFRVDSKNGYVEITKRGFAGFAYKCIVENKAISDSIHFHHSDTKYVQSAVETVSLADRILILFYSLFMLSLFLFV